jgi:hypothetical protein
MSAMMTTPPTVVPAATAAVGKSCLCVSECSSQRFMDLPVGNAPEPGGDDTPLVGPGVRDSFAEVDRVAEDVGSGFDSKVVSDLIVPVATTVVVNGVVVQPVTIACVVLSDT